MIDKLAAHREAFWSLLTAFVIQAAIVVSGILAARVLGSENRGHLQLLSLAPLIIGQVGFLGLPLALTYFIARNPANQRALIERVWKQMSLAAMGLLTVHAALLLVLLGDESRDLRLAAYSTLTAGPGTLAQFAGLGILQGQRRFGAFNVLRSLQVVVYSGALILIFASGATNLTVVTLAWSASVALSGLATLVFALVSVRQSRPGMSEQQEPPSLRHLTGFGLKSLAGWTNLFESFRVDQIFVGLFMGPAALGLYVVAQALTNLPRFLAQSIGMVAYPTIAGRQTSARQLTTRFMAMTLVVCGILILILEASAHRLIPFLFGGAFHDSVALSRVLLLASLVLSLKRVLHDCARGLGRPDLGLRAEVCSWLPLLPAFAAAGDSVLNVAWIVLGSSLVGLAVLAGSLIRSPLANTGRSPVQDLSPEFRAA